jgi:phosphatidylglycerophosphatase A
MPGLTIGVVTMKITNKTNITSMYGTTLMSADFGKIGLPEVLGINHWVIAVIFTIITLIMFRWFEKKGI